MDLEPDEFKKLDESIRQTLIHNELHLQPACKERLYLPRTELGRGLINIEHRSELMLLKLFTSFNQTKHVIKRRSAILKVHNNEKTHLWFIDLYLKNK